MNITNVLCLLLLFFKNEADASDVKAEEKVSTKAIDSGSGNILQNVYDAGVYGPGDVSRPGVNLIGDSPPVYTSEQYGTDQQYTPLDQADAGYYQTHPYEFKYQVDDGYGNQHGRRESSDGSGRVTGSYTIQTADGLYRQVHYTADEGGFRASIASNEPGVENKDPASVAISHENPPAGIYDSAPEYDNPWTRDYDRKYVGNNPRFGHLNDALQSERQGDVYASAGNVVSGENAATTTV